MADFNNPLSSQGYLALLASIVENNQAALQMLEGVSPLDNLPVNSKRWNTANARFENWDGTAWVELVALYEMKVRDSDQLNGQTEAFYRNATNLNAGTLPAGRFNDTAHGARAGGTLHAAATAAVNGFMSSSDKSKLNAIELGATADMTDSEVLAALVNVDGSGSGLDADFLDGNHAAALLDRANHTGTQSSNTIAGLGSLAELNSVNQITIDANAVGQSELKDAIGVVSVFNNALNLTLPGGSFGFYPQFKTSNTTSLLSASLASWVGLNTTYITTLRLSNDQTETSYAQQRYFTASPPYNLGDGDIPLFMFVIIDNTTKDIESVYVAPEAPWHYNGKTSIIASHKDKVSGRSWRVCGRVDYEKIANNLDIAYMLRGTTKERDSALAIIADKEQFALEITQAVKQRDMVDIPHPFSGNDLTGKTVILLDPVSPITEQLLNMHEVGEDVNGLIHEKYLTHGNTQIARLTPNECMCVDLFWKNTK